ncbi:uracil-DNA glycosylase [Candidatus Pelagibacter communis]|jgi:uracil-DNA glycosylase family 4|uniref:uracil-DNA glycosylase n=1 Tax=Pelagibacter ubique TaxID=198252 RepID=UPI00094C3895|nr:uracil-DNA glycosylase [Candidatus Pelagibacter ubique]|tara:strand:+ start:189 stop:875 length:687 start_codon:yes stop_codon:yes gene_type:complete
MNNEVLNDEFLKSIDSNYEFSNKPIRRLKKSQQPGEIKLQLENLKKQIAEIDACDLKNHANQLVFSDGNFRSKIMLVGEGPGQKEDEIGKPFMGDAGKLLNKMLAAIDIKRESIYITNVVNYRPPNNRKPTTAEINKYSKFLYEHISIINPKILIIMGGTAMEALIGNNFKISKERGIWKDVIIKGKTYLSIVTFHPAYLLRQPDQKKYSWIDLKEIRKKINELNIIL